MRHARKLSAAIALALTVSVPAGAYAEMARPGQFIVTQSHPQMPKPIGRYRTRVAWLVASMIAFENRSSGFDIFALATPGLYRNYLNNEVAAYRRLPDPQRYRYLDAMVRDFAQMQIVTLADNRMSMALKSVASGILADVVTGVLSAGISRLVPPSRAGAEALESALVDAGVQKKALTGLDIADLELRYKDLVSPTLFANAKRQLAAEASAGAVASLLSESVVSAAIGKAIDAYRGQPGRAMDVMRTQLVLEAAAYKCACALDQNTNRSPKAGIILMGGSDKYRTDLAAALSMALGQHGGGLINAFGGDTMWRNMLKAELAKIRGWKQQMANLGSADANLSKQADKARAEYATYLRGLLVDLESLERFQIGALQSGAAMSFVESSVLNVLFGLFAFGGGGLGMQAVATLANAGYGGFSTYNTVSDELKIRMQMAALREQVLDQLLPLTGVCGCGAGLAIVPDHVVKGAPAASQ